MLTSTPSGRVAGLSKTMTLPGSFGRARYLLPLWILIFDGGRWTRARVVRAVILGSLIEIDRLPLSQHRPTVFPFISGPPTAQQTGTDDRSDVIEVN